MSKRCGGTLQYSYLLERQRLGGGWFRQKVSETFISTNKQVMNYGGTNPRQKNCGRPYLEITSYCAS
jgi:hypothetical protein